MQQHLRKITVGMGAALIALTSGIALAQQSTVTTKETRKFSVIAVDGNTVVIRDQPGTREMTVPPDFRVTVEGRQVPVSELKPGMTGTAVITTTTTTKPVTVTEVKSGEVVEASGSSILVRTPEGFKMFSPSDIEKRGVKIIKDGKPLDFSQLRKGDKLTATIVTEYPPQILTERQVQATLAGAPLPPPTAAKPATSGTAGRPRSRRRRPPPRHRPPAGQARGDRQRAKEVAEDREHRAAPRSHGSCFSRPRDGADDRKATPRRALATASSSATQDGPTAVYHQPRRLGSRSSLRADQVFRSPDRAR